MSNADVIATFATMGNSFPSLPKLFLFSLQNPAKNLSYDTVSDKIIFPTHTLNRPTTMAHSHQQHSHD